VGIADDLVEAHEVWFTPDLETYLRAGGSMFTQVELYTEEAEEVVETEVAVLGRNLVTNPSFEVDTAGWFSGQGGGGTVTVGNVRQTTWASVGTSSSRNTATGIPTNGYLLLGGPTGAGFGSVACAPGQVFSARAVVNVATALTGTIKCRVEYFTAAGSYITGLSGTAGSLSDVALTNATGVFNMTVNGTVAPGTAAYVRILVYLTNTSGAPATVDFYVDAALLVQATRAPTYFDGSTAPAGKPFRTRWLGTSHASESEQYVLLDVTRPVDGWATLLDPARAPAAGLPYLAQYVGEHLPVGLAAADQREWIKDTPNQFRGTLMSIVRAAQRTLTGQRTVRIKPRAGVGGADDPNRLIVNTFVSETPSSAAVYADLLTVVPVDIDLVYDALAGQTWGDVNTAYASWAAVNAAYASWEALRLTIPPGYTAWTRPRS